MSKGGLIVSIDFELNWGYRNTAHLLSTKEVHDGLNSLKQLLDAYDIKSTWAIVGQLFLNCDKNILTGEKKTSNIIFDTASWIEKELKPDPKVEIGSHTFEHIFLQENTSEERLNDFRQMQQLENIGHKIKTIVFPRNQYDDYVLALSKEFGIEIFRGVKKKWWLQSSKHSSENKLKRALKRICELIPLSRSAEIESQGGLIGISDSRFFRFFPISFSGNLFTILYRRILNFELNYALRKGRFYHIWFHPHNIITKPDRINELDHFFSYFNKIKAQYEANSYTIKEIAEISK